MGKQPVDFHFSESHVESLWIVFGAVDLFHGKHLGGGNISDQVDGTEPPRRIIRLTYPITHS